MPQKLVGLPENHSRQAMDDNAQLGGCSWVPSSLTGWDCPSRQDDWPDVARQRARLAPC